jgi:hypothetical protein
MMRHWHSLHHKTVRCTVTTRIVIELLVYELSSVRPQFAHLQRPTEWVCPCTGQVGRVGNGHREASGVGRLCGFQIIS